MKFCRTNGSSNLYVCLSVWSTVHLIYFGLGGCFVWIQINSVFCDKMVKVCHPCCFVSSKWKMNSISAAAVLKLRAELLVFSTYLRTFACRKGNLHVCRYKFRTLVHCFGHLLWLCIFYIFLIHRFFYYFLYLNLCKVCRYKDLIKRRF